MELVGLHHRGVRDGIWENRPRPQDIRPWSWRPEGG